MNIAFTICSNNYLAHAKTAGDSFLKFHPDWTFIIGLVDHFDSTFDYSGFSNFVIIKVEDIRVPNFEDLQRKFNITELNTAVKAKFIKHIFSNYNANKLIYLDPDILVTSYFEEVITSLDFKNIIITPHICSPIDDVFAPTDYHTLRGGIFNLGFIALARYNDIKNFIDWWEDRVYKYGFNDFSKNMFYDQLWINYVPAMWDNYLILKHLGYNMANWNLHERKLSIHSTIDPFTINNEFPLRFFHFSGYKYENPTKIASYHTRFDFNSRPDLLPLFNHYHELLKSNNIEKISQLRYHYKAKHNSVSKSYKKKSIFQKMMIRLCKTIQVLITGKY